MRDTMSVESVDRWAEDGAAAGQQGGRPGGHRHPALPGRQQPAPCLHLDPRHQSAGAVRLFYLRACGLGASNVGGAGGWELAEPDGGGVPADGGGVLLPLHLGRASPADQPGRCHPVTPAPRHHLPSSPGRAAPRPTRHCSPRYRRPRRAAPPSWCAVRWPRPGPPGSPGPSWAGPSSQVHCPLTFTTNKCLSYHVPIGFCLF